MNLLSIGAVARRHRRGLPVRLARRPLRTSTAGPIDAFIPVMLFAIVFGLSMDYEVFLVSRIHEEWSARRRRRAPRCATASARPAG